MVKLFLLFLLLTGCGSTGYVTKTQEPGFKRSQGYTCNWEGRCQPK